MKKLIPVLESLGIYYAVSLDDEYDTETFADRHPSAPVEIFLDVYQAEFTEEELETIEVSGVLTIGQLLDAPTVSQDIKAKVRGIYAAQAQKNKVLGFLERGLAVPGFVFEKLGDVEHIREASDEGSIWFVDKEISGENALPKIIPEVVNKYDGNNLPCILVVFTDDDSFDRLNKSWQKRYEYLCGIGLDKDEAERFAFSFFIISKRKVSDKLRLCAAAAEDFVSQLLSDSMVGHCVYHIITQMKENARKSYEHLFNVAKQAERSTLENIFYNMVTEGEPNVYHAFKAIQGHMQEMEYVSGFATYEKYILAMKRLSITLGNSSKVASRSIEAIVHQYEWARYQFIHDDVNRVYEDVAYGDVFHVTYRDERYVGVLATQACDCILRSDEKKPERGVNRNARKFHLLLYTRKKIFSGKEPLDNAKQIQHDGIILDHFHGPDGEHWEAGYIDVTRPEMSLFLEPFILDLTTLDSEGQAMLLSEIQVREIVAKRKTQNWNGYLSALTESLSAFEENLELLKKALPEQAEAILASIYEIPFSIADLEFDIRRIGHLEPNLAALASYHYVLRAYRTGKNSLLSLQEIIGEQ